MDMRLDGWQPECDWVRMVNQIGENKEDMMLENWTHERRGKERSREHGGVMKEDERVSDSKGSKQELEENSSDEESNL